MTIEVRCGMGWMPDGRPGDLRPATVEEYAAEIERLRGSVLAALTKLDEAHVCCREIECERAGPDAHADRDDSCRLHDLRKILADAHQQRSAQPKTEQK